MKPINQALLDWDLVAIREHKIRVEKKEVYFEEVST